MQSESLLLPQLKQSFVQTIRPIPLKLSSRICLFENHDCCDNWVRPSAIWFCGGRMDNTFTGWKPFWRQWNASTNKNNCRIYCTSTCDLHCSSSTNRNVRIALPETRVANHRQNQVSTQDHSRQYPRCIPWDERSWSAWNDPRNVVPPVSNGMRDRSCTAPHSRFQLAKIRFHPVSYTHLTLPTILLV